ncbi:MAG: transposase [Polyangiaceae bacterium]
MFEKFAVSSPVAVMARALMERALEPKALDALFRKHAERQYEKALLFSSLVDLMALVVCGVHRSVRKAYEAMGERIPVTLSALYGKLDGVEVCTSQALVTYSAERLRPVIDSLVGTPGTPWLRGYRIKALDGNHLAATERRLEVLWQCAAGPLPGQALVVLDPETGLATQMVGCEDGHAQERSLLGPVLAGVQPKDVYIADRNFCTLGFLFGLAERRGLFVIRQHAKLPVVSEGTLRHRGRTDTGEVFEQSVTLRLEGQERVFRRIVLRLDTPTRDGDTEMSILTNVPAKDANARTITDLYRRRWTIESLFARVERNLRSEQATLGYPGAAVFAFAVALVASNVFAVVHAALTAAQKVHEDDAVVQMSLSDLSIVEEIRTVHRGMSITLDDRQWRPFQTMPAPQLARLLLRCAQHVHWRNFRKAVRGPKVTRKRTRFLDTPHVSTARLLGRA